MLTKYCLNCKKKFSKPYNCSLNEWNKKRKFCSRKCSNLKTLFKKGQHFSVNTEFKKGNIYGKRFMDGHIPFMKNKKHTLESRKKMSESSKGQIPWNKNKKGTYHIWPNGRIISQETRKKISNSLKGKTGELSRNWRGGISLVSHLIRTSDKYKEWRKSIFKRDNYICQECNAIGVNLHAHHIKSFNLIIKENNIKNLEDGLKCKELWHTNNGITLCKKCHQKIDTFGFNK